MSPGPPGGGVPNVPILGRVPISAWGSPCPHQGGGLHWNGGPQCPPGVPPHVLIRVGVPSVPMSPRGPHVPIRVGVPTDTGLPVSPSPPQGSPVSPLKRGSLSPHVPLGVPTFSLGWGSPSGWGSPLKQGSQHPHRWQRGSHHPSGGEGGLVTPLGGVPLSFLGGGGRAERGSPPPYFCSLVGA